MPQSKKRNRLFALLAVLPLMLGMVLPTHGAQVLESQELELQPIESSVSGLVNQTILGVPKHAVYMEEDGGSYSVAPLSIDDDSVNRRVSYNGLFRSGTKSRYSSYTSGTQDFNRAPSGSIYQYSIASGTLSISNAYPYIYASSGTYVDYLAPVNIDSDLYSTISVSGVISCLISNSNSWTDGYDVIIPNKAQIIINDTLVGEPVTGPNFDFSGQEITITEDIIYIGIRFTFTSSQSSASQYTKSYVYDSVIVRFSDAVYFIYNEKSEEAVYIPILTEILQAIRNLPNLITGGLTLPDKQEQADQFQEDMSGAVSDMDNIKQEIEEGLEKPPPETIVPDIDIIVDTSDEYHVQYSEILADLLGNAMITNLLLIVASMMFVSYVLFGKKG